MKYNTILKTFQHPTFVIMIGNCQSLEYSMGKEYIGALILIILKDYSMCSQHGHFNLCIYYCT